MKNKMKLLMYTIFTLFLSFASCDGEDGAIGPQGPSGQNGTNGQDGNANVIASNWVATNFSLSSSSLSLFDIKDANITSANTNNAAILAYGKTSGGVVMPIPLTLRKKSYYFVLFTDDTKIRFLGVSISGNLEVFNDFSEVRYVIIPPTAAKGAKNLNFTKMSYEEVMNHFNLAY